ncbi:MAG: methylmalonyl Co-A mutase-associated GTPase MeaB [Balneolaceae bacterium]
MPDNPKRKKTLSVQKGTGSQESVNPDFRHKKSGLKTKEEYVKGINEGNRIILSQVITLIESSKETNRSLGLDILEACMENAGDSLRIGITGVPGVGKSTFIEAMGQKILKEEKKLAVLTIDPSSSRTKGSILGDKTRMQHLSNHENAFIRPSPASGTLGGVARKSRETMLLCEAAGFDTIFIETVGVGQSETAVHSMVDFFLLLMLPGAGDELQGIKRGIMEMADLIAINKAEDNNKQPAERARMEYKNALSLFPDSPSGWNVPVKTCSALRQDGIAEIWQDIKNYLDLTKNNGYFSKRRKEQAIHWMYESIHEQLKEQFYRHPEVGKKLKETEQKVQEGKLSSFKGAEELMSIFKETGK